VTAEALPTVAAPGRPAHGRLRTAAAVDLTSATD
jgi:hypothetical protein